MPVLKLVRSAAVILATAGLVMPMPTAQAADSHTVSRQSAAATVAADVSKLKDGSFAGRVVDHEGTVVEDAEVVVRQGNKVLLRARTDAEGMFAFKNLKPGSYQVTSGSTEGLFRVWNDQAAPPSARKNALLVLGQNGARGQYGGVDEYGPGGWGGFPSLDPTILLIAGGVVGAVVISAITLQKTNDIKNKVDRIPTSP